MVELAEEVVLGLLNIEEAAFYDFRGGIPLGAFEHFVGILIRVGTVEIEVEDLLHCNDVTTSWRVWFSMTSGRYWLIFAMMILLSSTSSFMTIKGSDSIM
jgi:hypothetical protein